MEIVKKLINKPLSSKEVLEMMNYECNFIIYPNIHKYENIDQILGKYKQCILLYETRPDYGHYCCLYEINDRIFFFDSYGFIPDDELGYIPKSFRKVSKQDYKYLTKLLYDSHKIIEYNEFPLQSKKLKVSTCGYHCVTRLKYKKIPVKTYAEILSDYMPKITPDYLVILLNI